MPQISLFHTANNLIKMYNETNITRLPKPEQNVCPAAEMLLSTSMKGNLWLKVPVSHISGIVFEV